MMQSILMLLPEIVLASAACGVLLLDLMLTDRQRSGGLWFAVASLVATAVIVMVMPDVGTARLFNGMFVDDALARSLKVVILLLSALSLVYSRGYLGEAEMQKGEYHALVLSAALGMLVLCSAGHMLSLYLGLELLSLSLYALVAFRRDSSEATEAAMKYFVLGALASGLLLYGLSILYGVTGTLDIQGVHDAISNGKADNVALLFALVFVLAGLCFKLGIAPFHMWVPDVYHGAPAPVVLFLSTAPKVAAFALLVRLLVEGMGDLIHTWRHMFEVLAILSLAVGNLIAIAQTNLKRMLAYSAIAHMGFLIIGLIAGGESGLSSAMFYAVAYGMTGLAAFGLLLILSQGSRESDSLDDLKGLGDRSPWLAFLGLLIMFSLAGVPPTLGFYAKFLVIKAAVDMGAVWLAVLAVLFSVIGAFYYLRVVKLIYFDKSESAVPIRKESDLRVLLSVNALALVLCLPWLGVLTVFCAHVIRASLGAGLGK